MPKSQSESRRTEVTAEPALEKRTRRQFSTEYKLRIIAEANACPHGELGALLRREKLYSNQLSDWRRIEQLEKENNRLQRKLDVANDCLELQKKALAMLDRLRNGNDA